MPDYRGMRLSLSPSDSEHQGYFVAARQHRLVVRKCSDCSLLRWPPSPGCPWCASLSWVWQEVSGRGAIYSYQIVAHAIEPGLRDWVPYPVVLVELDEQRGIPTPEEGLRLVANLVDEDLRPEKEEKVAIGRRVEVVFMDIAPDFTLPQFRLSPEQARGPVWRCPGRADVGDGL